MKTTFLTTAMLLAGISAGAQTPIIVSEPTAIVEDISVSDVKMEKNGNYFVVDMNLILSELDVESNRAVLLTPRLVNAADTLNLPAVGIYGRTRYYFYVRQGESMLSDEREDSYRSKERPEQLSYHQVVDYQDWMDGADFSLQRKDYGCCHSLLAEQAGMLGRYMRPTDSGVFFPELVFVQAEAEAVKERSLEGSAYVEFVVNRTDIRPDYRNNVAELGKIQASIDSLNTDGDVSIKNVWLKGYASPESPYAHNTKLAKGRTEAVKNYIKQLYRFPDSVILTDYEPENWAGLRAYVEASNINNREAILKLIDSDRKPDPKEAAIKSQYPQEYRFLLDNCYPALRRTDYRIAYDIRTYTDIEEIKRIMATAPQKLSLNEFYLLAQQYEPGSDEFTEVFETAVRMYPQDEVANLNAANAAMRYRDNVAAARYIDKMGTSPEAVYARGAYAFLTGDYKTARTLFQEALDLGIEEAAATLRDLDGKIKEVNRNKKNK